MTGEKVHFSEEKETMLMTLHGRAVQSKWEKPILRDPWAEEAERHIDYDFGKVDRMGGIFAPLFARLGCAIVATRAATFDALTRSFLSEHPDAVVLHLGCGMDSRVFRVDPPAGVQWFDVDYPDVIDLRRKLFTDRADYRMIGSSLDDLDWLKEVPGGRPALVIAEGVFPYLAEASVKALLNAVAGQFTLGEVVFDAGASWVVKRTGSNVGNTGATYRWALDDPRDIKKLEPRLELVKEYKNRDLVGYSQFPALARVLYRLMELNTAMRRMHRILVYKF